METWASIAVSQSGKCAAPMAAENCTSCRKYASTVSLNIWDRMDLLRICAIFCRYWTCSFSGRNNQAIGPRLSAIFTYFYIPIMLAMRVSQKIRSYIAKQSTTLRPTVPAWPDSTIEMAVISASCLSPAATWTTTTSPISVVICTSKNCMINML